MICLGNNARRAILFALDSVGERFNNAANYRARARARARIRAAPAIFLTRIRFSLSA